MSRVIPGVAVPERVRHDLHVDAGEHERGCPVAEVVQPDRWEAGGSDEVLEEVGDLAGVQPGAVFLGEDEAGLDPGRCPLLAVRHLLLAMPLQHVDGVVVEDHDAEPAVGLESPLGRDSVNMSRCLLGGDERE